MAGGAPMQQPHSSRPHRMAALITVSAAIGAGLILAAAVLFTNHPAVLAAAAASALALAWASHARGAALAASVAALLPPSAAAAWANLICVRAEVVVAAGFACVAALAGLKLGVLAGYALALRVAGCTWPAGAATVRAVASRDPGGLVYLHAW